MTTAAQITAAYPKVSSSLAQEIVNVATRLGFDPAWLANLINFETGGTFSPNAKNPYSSATGLIQFMEATAKGLGTTTTQLAKMSAVQQMAYVEKYLKPYAGRIREPVDLAMAVFYPAAIGKGEGYTFSAAVQKVNPGIKTAGDYLRLMTRNAKLSSASRGAQALVSGEATAAVRSGQLTLSGYLSAVPWWGWASLAGLVGVGFLMRRRE